MSFSCLQDKDQIEQFLRRNVYLHIYSIGDLDDFFWPYTKWYGLTTNGRIDALALLYTGQSLPTLLALSEQPDVMKKLITSMKSILPDRFYAHLSPGVETALVSNYNLEAHGEHYKMALRNKSAIFKYNYSEVVHLSEADLQEIQQFYKQSYPSNWFDARMLQTNQYFGIRQNGVLISIAGIHVYSRQYSVAALGNIATLLTHRGRGHAKTVTAKLCESLSEHIDHIGLNVKSDNTAAISCYRRLGFEPVATYGEFTVQERTTA